MSLDQRVDKLSETIHKLELDVHGELVAIRSILERNTISLEEHVRRTNLLEERLARVEVPVNWVMVGLQLLAAAVPTLVWLGWVLKWWGWGEAPP